MLDFLIFNYLLFFGFPIIPIGWLVYFAFVHWIGDFVLQTHKMAVNKSSSWFWLSQHVMVYTLTMLVGGFCFFLTWMDYKSALIVAFVFAIWNGLLHLAVDIVTSRVTAHFWQKNDMHNFFVVVGIDQFLHCVCIFYTLIFTLVIIS